MFTLPPEIIQKIYEYDPTYHRDQQKIVIHQLTRFLLLREAFTQRLSEIILNPFYKYYLLNTFRKDEFVEYAKMRGIKVFRRLTKSRLLTVIVWFQLRL